MDSPELRKAIRSVKRSQAADWVQIIAPALLVVLVALGTLLGLHTLTEVRRGQIENHRTLTLLEGALSAGPAAQDQAIRQLLGCPKAPAPCQNLRQLIQSLAVQESDKLDSLLSRPVQTRIVTRDHTIIITRTVVVCRRPNGKPC